MKIRYLLSFVALLGISAPIGHTFIFDVPPSSELISDLDLSTPLLECHLNSKTTPIDIDGQIQLLVWNIYKQNNPQWRSSIVDLSSGKSLVLLQEASATDELSAWIQRNHWDAKQVNAFKVMDVSAGVLTLSSAGPAKSCAYTYTEPWLQLPKSAIYTQYELSNGQQLAVMNLHAVNFTVGTEDYEKQLSQLESALSKHKGPLIFAGDFNSWSEKRMDVMREVLSKLSLKHVVFSPDYRTRFLTGYPLDHVFVRGLDVKKAEALKTSASDHNPLLVELQVQ